jgi:hypothetical protein
MKELRFQVRWSKDGSLQRSQLSDILPEAAARALAHQKREGNRCVTLLCEHQSEGVNAGKFFLHQIIK